MGKNENWIYGFFFLLGGAFVLIFVGSRLIDLLSKIVFYFMLIFFIVLMLYGVILILISILIMPFNIRVNKIVALIISLIGVLIIILSITVIIIDSYTIVNTFEILSGIGLILLGIRLFFHPKLKEEGKLRGKKIIGIIGLIIGLTISLPYGFSLIGTIIISDLEFIFYVFPFHLLPLLVGIILVMLSIYSLKTTHTAQERNYKSIFSILIGAFIVITSGFAINSMLHHSHYYIFYTFYFPLIFLIIGFVLILYGFLLHRDTPKGYQEDDLKDKRELKSQDSLNEKTDKSF